MDKLERVARSIKDAGDWMFEDDELYRMAQAAIAALEPVTVQEAARVLLTHLDTRTEAVKAYKDDLFPSMHDFGLTQSYIHALTERGE